MAQKPLWKKCTDYSLYRLYIENTMLREILSIFFWIIIIMSVFTRQGSKLTDIIPMLIWFGSIFFFLNKYANMPETAQGATPSATPSAKSDWKSYIYKTALFVLIFLAIPRSENTDETCNNNVFTICNNSIAIRNLIYIVTSAILLSLFIRLGWECKNKHENTEKYNNKQR